MTSYRYPSRPHLRKHGPRGYRTAVDFRPWLRDEFLYRCVYCLEREQWVNCIGHFHGDHFRSAADHPDLELEYDNLLYVCKACNFRKGKQSVANPLDSLLSSDVTVRRNGSIQGRTKEAKELIDLLRLDSLSYRNRCKTQPQSLSRTDELSRRSPRPRSPSATRRQLATERREEVLLRTTRTKEAAGKLLIRPRQLLQKLQQLNPAASHLCRISDR